MYTTSFLLSSLFALTATAKPINTNLIERSSASSGSDTFNIEICNNCHPFFTGKQKLMDAGGRVERFQRRLEKAGGARRG